MYEGFSGQARQAIQLAYEEARRRRHDYVGTEHVLLGVLREGAAGPALLAAAGAEAEAVYRAVAALPPGNAAATWDQLPLTPAAKRALEAARQEAAALGHPCVGPEDLLLGLLREAEGGAAQALLALGLTAEGLRTEAAKRPQPENRDWMLRPEPRPGDPPRGDPTAGDLAARVSPDVLPPQRAGQANRLSSGPLWRRSGRADALPTDASLGVPVVEKQLRVLQVLVACVVGSVAGAVTLGALWAILGWVLGWGVAALRSGIVGGVAGAAAGAAIGWMLSYENPVCYVSGGLAGGALGALLGDWRRLPASLGGGQGPPPKVFDNDME